jgi:hypothetical protein
VGNQRLEILSFPIMDRPARSIRVRLLLRQKKLVRVDSDDIGFDKLREADRTWGWNTRSARLAK